MLFSCNSLKEEHLEQHITCDAEIEVDFLNKKYIEGSDGLLLTGGSYRSEEEAHSGKYSIKLGGDDTYAFQVKFKEIEKDMFVRATVWRKGKQGNLALTSKKNTGFQAYSKTINAKDSLGWEQLILEAFVPANYDGGEIKLFVMNSTDKEGYFDDLEVKVYKKKPYPEYPELDNINLIIDSEYIEEIEKNRIKSFWKGVISKKTKKEYPAVFEYAGKSLEAEVRIKGDWLDHIQGNKWSFRIKLKDGNFYGMREFSIQQPEARGFMHEYVLHKIFLEEDVLTTRYGFVPVKINGDGRGIYAYEEHFAKHLIESRDRREGPITKFDETALWEINQSNLSRKDNYLSGPIVESSVITPFKKKKTTKNITLKGNFDIAQNLLNQYRLDASPISELFKVDKLATFYSLINIGRTWHSMRWHNERYYYDPLSSKMEIIAYDCYTAVYLDDLNIALTPEVIETTVNFDYDKYLAYSPFNDAVFMDAYIKVMDNYVNSDRIESILDKYKEEISFNSDLIHKEYSYYHYDASFMTRGIDGLKSRWGELKPKLESGTIHANLVIEPYNYKDTDPIKGMNLQAFVNTPYELNVQNFHSEKLYLIGYSSKKLPEQGVVNFDEAIEFPPYVNLKELKAQGVETAFSPTKIYYKTSLEDSIVYDSKVMKWPLPGVDSPRQNLLKRKVEKSNNIYEVSDSLIVFKKGKHIIKAPLIIPAGKKVIMEEGVHLDFINKAFFMSFSSINMIGIEGQPVIIESSDGSAMGFTIIDAMDRSNLNYVLFRGFNTLSYEGWNLTGAVSFYQSDVDIFNTQFLENNCEDALNIVRSDFLMSKSLIGNAFADGFDADFATGNVENSKFEDIGNDGLDFSGSLINIKDVEIVRIGDKGISGGESSTLFIENCEISDANIGIASKDRSVVSVKNIVIKESFCAFAVYQKKSEYEPAKMQVENAELISNQSESLLGLGSILILDGKEESGVEKLNIDSLYGL